MIFSSIFASNIHQCAVNCYRTAVNVCFRFTVIAAWKQSKPGPPPHLSKVVMETHWEPEETWTYFHISTTELSQHPGALVGKEQLNKHRKRDICKTPSPRSKSDMRTDACCVCGCVCVRTDWHCPAPMFTSVCDDWGLRTEFTCPPYVRQCLSVRRWHLDVRWFEFRRIIPGRESLRAAGLWRSSSSRLSSGQHSQAKEAVLLCRLVYSAQPLTGMGLNQLATNQMLL